MNNKKYGIYLIRNNKKVIYVGIDKNIALEHRLKQHISINRYHSQLINKFLQDNNNWNYESYELNLSKHHALFLEKQLIRMFKPKFNIQHNEKNEIKQKI